MVSIKNTSALCSRKFGFLNENQILLIKKKKKKKDIA